MSENIDPSNAPELSQPPIDNDHVEPGATLFTPEEIAANRSDAMTMEEALAAFAENPGLWSVRVKTDGGERDLTRDQI